MHHQFTEPSAFAQDAVHPFEAVLQDPIGTYSFTLYIQLPIVPSEFCPHFLRS